MGSTGRIYDVAINDTSTVIASIEKYPTDITAKSADKFEIIIHEKVSQQRAVFNTPSVRRLVIEMFSIFDKCQKIHEDQGSLDTLTCCQISRTYRSVLLNTAITNSNSEFLTDFSLWSLYEKLYFNRGDGSICADLMSWANESFSFVKKQVEKSADDFDDTSGKQSEEFWRGVAVSLMTCHFEECGELLSLFSNEPGIDSFLNSLAMFDADYLIDEAKIDKISEWKDFLRENLKYSKYGANENLEFLTKLLLGEEKCFQTMIRLFDNWWHILPFYVLSRNPVATYTEFLMLAENCKSLFYGGKNETSRDEEDIFWCLITRDEENFYQLLMNNPWISVHLVDLIQKSTDDPELVELHKNLILNYGSTLIMHSDLWEIGAFYLTSCGTEGLLRFETHVEQMHIEDDEMAEKLLEICEYYQLMDSKTCVTNTMTYRYLKMEEWSAALGWALKSGSKRTIDGAISKIVSSSRREELAALSILNSISSQSVLSLPSLTFLFSYQSFVKKMQNGEIVDCVQHLIPLIMMADVPTQYYYDLFDYLITIIREDNQKGCIKFPKELLYELSSFLATFSMDKNCDLNEKYQKKVNILKKMVMLKLAESISKGFEI